MERDVRLALVVVLMFACLFVARASVSEAERNEEMEIESQLPMQHTNPSDAHKKEEEERKKKEEEEKKKKKEEEEKKKKEEEEKKKKEEEEKKKKEEEEKKNKHTPNGLLGHPQPQPHVQPTVEQPQKIVIPQPTPTPQPVYWLRRRQRPVSCSMYPCVGRSRAGGRENDLCLANPSYRTEYPQCESHCCTDKKVVFVIQKCPREERKACKGVYDFSSCTCYVHEEGYCQQFAPIYHPTRRRRMKRNVRDSDNARECKRMCEAFNEEDSVKCIAWVFTKGKGWNQKCNAWGPTETDLFGSRRANQCYMYLKNDEGEWGHALKNPKALNRAFQTRPQSSTDADCSNSDYFHPKYLGKFDLPVGPCEGCISGAVYPYRYANVPLPKSTKSGCKYDSRGLIPTPSDSSWHRMCKTTSKASFDFDS